MSKQRAADERVLERMREDGAWLIRRGLNRWNFCTETHEVISGRGVHSATVGRLRRKGLVRLFSAGNEAYLTVQGSEQSAALGTARG